MKVEFEMDVEFGFDELAGEFVVEFCNSIGMRGTLCNSI